MKAIRWIQSGGGPLLFAPASAAKAWRGDTRTPGLCINDYERACAVKREIEVIHTPNAADALVLGDEPDRTTLFQHPAVGLIIVRWRWAKSEEALFTAITAVDLGTLPAQSESSFATISEKYLLFDAAYSGSEAKDTLNVDMTAGVCRFDVLYFQPDRDTSAVLHRLRMKK